MRELLELGGIGVVNATPLHEDGSINFPEYLRHVRWLVDSGVGFVQPHAATGQGVMASESEYRDVLLETVREVNGRALVTAYAGRVGTAETIRAVEVARDAKCDAAFIIQPWYSNPDGEGLYLHFKAVAESTDLPLVIYNNPARSGVSIPVGVMRRLAEDCPQFVALKESDLRQVVDSFRDLRELLSVSVYGDAELLWALAMGAQWSVSYSANAIAPEWVEVFRLWQNSEIDKARSEFYRLLRLVRLCLCEPLPAAVKYMMGRRGWNFGPCKLPVHEVSDVHGKAIDGALEGLGLAP